MIRRHIRVALIAAIGAVTLSIAAVAPASAIPGPAAVSAAEGSTGWVRLGHFSPDTKQVDVRVTALRGGSTVLELAGVGYGDVSPYAQLGTGSYTVAMVAAGSNSWADPVLSARLTVDAGSASTLAAYGPSRDLRVRAFTDDLSAPAAGSARIRLIQASTLTDVVDVRTTTGVSIAQGARAGSVTPYTEVPAGPWTFELTGDGVADTATVDAPSGSVATLFVLDTADGGLTILPVLDSAAAAVTPDGGVQTGGGWLAHAQTVTRTGAGLGAGAVYAV
ncbi:DUF4397 domain-containing protein [Microbacterium sp. SLBN-146]|uniref:DUF4397 domain-containing protein n=1 Tax=Microbacterium sp. SLBN-146 TaxID=2768457 RepID=UPI0013582376|nr:DUF4397 domain-containing protein [Microbacterium sp. SLBN-146]